MTIPIRELEVGSWYDGFVFRWNKGKLKQVCASYGIWLTEEGTGRHVFWVPEFSHWMPHYHTTATKTAWLFEPNTARGAEKPAFVGKVLPWDSEEAPHEKTDTRPEFIKAV